LTLRTVSDDIGRPMSIAGVSDSLFELTWPSMPDLPDPSTTQPPTWAVCTDSPGRLPASLSDGPVHTELATVTPCPDLVIWLLPRTEGMGEGEAESLRRVHTLTRHVLAQLQGWLARSDTANTRLMILTRHAVSVSVYDGVPDLAHAAVWALIHTAQQEQPDRIILLDTDDSAASKDNLLAIASTRPASEPQLALRNGVVHIPRLARTSSLTPPDAPAVLDSEGTVLVTGGTGMLGALVAEHLVTRHRIKHLLLVSRSGPDAPGAGELQQRLAGLGAEVAITACDTSNRDELAAVLDSIAAGHPLTAVIHAAGVLADAVVTELTPQQLDVVLAAKADSAWHLHNLTAELDLAAFVLFSSAAAILGSPGQANYAAANAFLDALARHRNHTRRATSLAWGYWHTPTGMTGHLTTTDLTRLTNTGLTPITNEQGLALFDATLTDQRPNLLASPVNTSALTRHARDNTLDPVLSALTTNRPQAATASPGGLVARLAGQTAEQQLRTLTTMVANATATVLAHPDPAAIDPDRPFKDLGIDSLTALELRNTLNHHTGLTLPATLAFDHPTPATLARRLREQLSGNSAISGTHNLPEGEIKRLISIIPGKRLADAGVLAMLREIADDMNSAGPKPEEDAIASMSLSELMNIARGNKSNQ
jgi:NAD(P)-dependent dehydrogenase (short-subunit alcohol dehydrogenase family)/acyl carrier protein